MKKFMKSKKGFTLVELIVVVAVLGILAAIAIPVASNLVSTANTNTDNANIALFESAIERYTATATDATPAGGGGTYPSSGALAGTAVKRFTNIGTSGTIPVPRQGGVFLYTISTHKVSVGPASSIAAGSVEQIQ